MSISLLLEMAESADSDRVAVISGDTRLTVGELDALANGAAALIADADASHVAYIGTGGATLPVLLFGSARAGVPFTPLNYRLSAHTLRSLIDRLPDPLVVVDTAYRDIPTNTGVVTSQELLAGSPATSPVARTAEPESVAVSLFTSGTTSQPKAVELTHHNLTSYITNTVDFASAENSDTVLICVPPYHIAGVGAALSNLYAGRKMLYLTEFDAEKWVQLVEDGQVSTATVVPTMLSRIVAEIERTGRRLPALRHLAYGGSRVPAPLIRKALELLPHVDFVNAYGLTETSSTITVLGPEDHRAALRSSDPSVARRLTSVGRPVADIETEIRDPHGRPVRRGDQGELFVRGQQVSGTYTGVGSVLDDQGWFPTKDLATIDEDGYVYVLGRVDDTIIRGGENIAPAEIEDVLLEHPGVVEVAVVGVEDPQWGQAVVAVVQPHLSQPSTTEQLREYVRQRLRGSRTPDRVIFWTEIPTNATGKVLRRNIIDELNSSMSEKSEEAK